MPKTPLLNLFFELGQLRRIKHEGWRFAGVDSPESVADHSLRAAQIAYFLAKKEDYKHPHEVVTMVVFHDIGECRVGDVHKIANRYISDVNEKQAVADQLEKVDATELIDMWDEVEERSSQAGIIAKDADLLEQAVMAKEYIAKGHSYAQDWIDVIEQHLKTKSAQALLQELKNVNPHEWWQGLKKM